MGENSLSSDNSQILLKADLSKLSDEGQKIWLSHVGEGMNKGFMDKIFGTNSERVAMYVALFICLILGIIGLAVMCFTKENIWSSILPIMSLSIGYIFGKKP